MLREGSSGDTLKRWLAGMRIIPRRETPTPQGRLGQLAHLQARHHARVEDCIRNTKDTDRAAPPVGLVHLNRAWCLTAAIACKLLAWLRLLSPNGDLAKAEPEAPRYWLLHTNARLIQRKRHLRIPDTWPWTYDLATRPYLG